MTEPRSIQPGDKVLIEATVTAIDDSDPFVSSYTVFFNGQSAMTDIMNIHSYKYIDYARKYLANK